jgi:hypothetical protein
VRYVVIEKFSEELNEEETLEINKITFNVS